MKKIITTYLYEETGLPDNPKYRKAFEKGLKALIISAQSSSPEEAQKAFAHISVLPAKIVCQLGLPPEREACIVKTLLNGHSVFTQIANCDVRKLQSALLLGLQESFTLAPEKLKETASKMSPDERLMVQLAIYTMVETAYDCAKSSAVPYGYDAGESLLASYHAVSRGEYPLLDKIVDEKCDFLHKKCRNAVTAGQSSPSSHKHNAPGI